MTTYYLDQRGNYLSDYNGNLYIHSIEDGDPILKRHRPVLYKNGKFIKVKPYIGQWKASGFLTSEKSYLATADGAYFLPSESSSYVAAASDSDVQLIFTFAQVSPYLITGMYESTYITDNYNNILTDNYNQYLKID